MPLAECWSASILGAAKLEVSGRWATAIERRDVADSFAPSILWAGDLIAVDAGSMLLDVTSLAAPTGS